MVAKGELKNAITLILKDSTFGLGKESLIEQLVDLGFDTKSIHPAISRLLRSGYLIIDPLYQNIKIRGEVNNKPKREKIYPEAIKNMKPEEIAELLEEMWFEIQRLNMINEQWKEHNNRMYNIRTTFHQYIKDKEKL